MTTQLRPPPPNSPNFIFPPENRSNSISLNRPLMLTALSPNRSILIPGPIFPRSQPKPWSSISLLLLPSSLSKLLLPHSGDPPHPLTSPFSSSADTTNADPYSLFLTAPPKLAPPRFLTPKSWSLPDYHRSSGRIQNLHGRLSSFPLPTSPVQLRCPDPSSAMSSFHGHIPDDPHQLPRSSSMLKKMVS